jgi:hypothetical protein
MSAVAASIGAGTAIALGTGATGIRTGDKGLGTGVACIETGIIGLGTGAIIMRGVLMA